MTRPFIALVSSAIVIAFAGSAPAQDAKIERGKQVYAAQRCGMCHSIEGKGNANGPLDGVGAKLPAADIKQWIVDPAAMTEKTKAARKPSMKVNPALPAEDVDALVAYMVSLKKK
jgi:mono/diheme cytochrome c family protein